MIKFIDNFFSGLIALFTMYIFIFDKNIISFNYFNYELTAILLYLALIIFLVYNMIVIYNSNINPDVIIMRPIYITTLIFNIINLLFNTKNLETF